MNLGSSFSSLGNAVNAKIVHLIAKNLILEKKQIDFYMNNDYTKDVCYNEFEK
jgi:hypothetical protein